MIAFIRGPVAAVDDEAVIVDIGGVGIAVSAPLAMLEPRPVIGEEIFLYTSLQVREDAWTLYGFTNKEQLRIFRLLIGVSGVGAKTALAIVDKVNPSRFAAAIAAREAKIFTAVSGVGKKSAERILLELKDKFPSSGAESMLAEETAPATEELNPDLLAALKQLGYTASEARAFAIKAQLQLGADAPAERLLREALKIAMKS